MSQTKTKRLIEKAVKQFCSDNNYEYIKYAHGKCRHDKIFINVWGIVVSCNVSCTPSGGAQHGATRAVNRLQTKIVRLRQNIIEGKIDVSKTRKR